MDIRKDINPDKPHGRTAIRPDIKTRMPIKTQTTATTAITSDKPITTIISDRVSAGVMRMAITLVINTANTQAVRTAS